MLQAALEAAGTRVHTLESRAKDLESLGRKVSRPSENDPERPKYSDALKDITDLAGVRVITFLLDEVDQVSAQVRTQFRIVEKINKSGLLVEEEKLGYHSVHYLVGFSDARREMPEYARFGGLTTEIQVRTILQHAWAEIEYDIQYKAIETIPSAVRRRFMALAGLLEIADREFQAVSEQDEADVPARRGTAVASPDERSRGADMAADHHAADNCDADRRASATRVSTTRHCSRRGPSHTYSTTPRSPVLSASTARAPSTADVYDEQLRRWCTGTLTSAQKREMVRLEDANCEWRALLTDILALAEELATGTIERQLSKSDLQLGVEHLLRGHAPR